MIVLAFVLGYMCSGMMKQMCGRRLVEGGFGDFLTNVECTASQADEALSGNYEPCGGVHGTECDTEGTTCIIGSGKTTGYCFPPACNKITF